MVSLSIYFLRTVVLFLPVSVFWQTNSYLWLGPSGFGRITVVNMFTEHYKISRDLSDTCRKDVELCRIVLDYL